MNAGRITHLLPLDTPEESKDEILGALTEKDATAERFRGLNDDAPVTGLPIGLETGTAWISKTVGDP